MTSEEAEVPPSTLISKGGTVGPTDDLVSEKELKLDLQPLRQKNNKVNVLHLISAIFIVQGVCYLVAAYVDRSYPATTVPRDPITTLGGYKYFHRCSVFADRCID